MGTLRFLTLRQDPFIHPLQGVLGIFGRDVHVAANYADPRGPCCLGIVQKLGGKAAVRQIFAFMRASTALPSTAARCTYLDTMPDFHPPIALSCCSVAPSRASIVAAVCRVQ